LKKTYKIRGNVNTIKENFFDKINSSNEVENILMNYQRIFFSSKKKFWFNLYKKNIYSCVVNFSKADNFVKIMFKIKTYWQLELSVIFLVMSFFIFSLILIFDSFHHFLSIKSSFASFIPLFIAFFTIKGISQVFSYRKAGMKFIEKLIETIEKEEGIQPRE
jgi:hypothetical protein